MKPICRIRWVAAATAALGLSAFGLVAAAPAMAGSAIAAYAANQGLSGTPSSMYQTNNTVTSLAYSNGVVYAGGPFTSVSPPSGTSGSTVTRTDLAGFSASTGVVTSFDPTLNGAVNAISVSPDGTTLYVGGAFTTVNGSTRNHFAAFTIATGALTSWNPNAGSGQGYSIAATSTGVYIGGTFGTVGGVAHQDLAEVAPVTGALLTAFTATADNEIASLAPAPTVGLLLVAGNFNTLSGTADHGFGAVNLTTGAYDAYGAASSELPNTQFCTSDGTDIIISGSVAYVGGDGIQPGCFDGDFALNLADGSIVWNNPCEGSTVALAMINGVLYKGSHMHDCSYNAGGDGGGFTGSLMQSNRVFYRLAAQNPADGTFYHWSPNTGAGGTTHVGPLAFATDGTQLFVGGDFPTVNNKTQEGITRFAPGVNTAPVAPNTAATATVSGPGSVSVTVPGDTDIDSGVLTYTLYRGSTVIGTQAAESWPWAQPTVRFTDTSVKSGTAYTYQYTVSDGTNTTSKSPKSASVTASSTTAPASWASTIAGESPSMWWRLNGDASDSSGNGNAGTFEGNVTTSTAAPITGGGSVALDGSTGYIASAATQTPTTAFTQSEWINTSTLSGAGLMAFMGTQAGGTGEAVDRAIWMDDDGQIDFAMDSPAQMGGFPGGPPPGPSFTQVRSAGSYNDGKWHLITATYDGTTMSLYVDGVLVGSSAETQVLPAAGYWVAGYADLASFNHVFGTNSTTSTAPNSYYLNGSLSEVATYPTALTAAQVAGQWAAGSASAISVSGG
jgi:hypothetical protein